MLLERRQNTRQRLRRPAYASMGEGPESLILDASKQGLALKTDLPIAVGSRGQIKLELLGPDTCITADARVAWSAEQGHTGIEFLGLPPESCSQLKDWLKIDSEPERHWTVTMSLSGPTRDGSAIPFGADAQLASVAEQAVLLTRAHGGAIALNDGSSMLCRASAGEIAPPLGFEINPRSGLTGACISAGQVLRCDDADSDPVVDRESCQNLGVRSIIAAPILLCGSVVGLIEVFSRQACAFDDVDCHSLERLAKKLTDSMAGDELQSQVEPRAAQSLIVSDPDLSKIENYALPLGAAYQFSWVEKLMLHKRAALFAVAAIGLAAAMWLGFGMHGSFGNHPASSGPANLRSSGQEIPPKPSAFRSTRGSTTLTPNLWLDAVRKRSERGDPDAELKLGAAYANGQEVQQNYSEAVKWLTRATDHGNATAAAELGAFYWEGRGVTQDYVEAYVWSTIAQAEGNEASSYRLAILQSRMSPIELSEAKQRATAWLRAHGGKQLASESNK